MEMKSQPIYPFQEYVRSAIRQRKYIGLETFFGSGKTYLSLQWLADLEAQGCKVFPCLVLTLKSVVPQWGEEIELHTDSDYCTVLGNSARRAKILRNVKAPIYILNYDCIRNKAVCQPYEIYSLIHLSLTRVLTSKMLVHNVSSFGINV